MDSFSVEKHAVYEIEFISQRQSEETQVDPLSQSLLVEHRHVNDVGRTTNQKQEGQNNGALEPFNKGFHLEADKVVGVVPWNEAIELQNSAAISNAVRAGGVGGRGTFCGVGGRGTVCGVGGRGTLCGVGEI